MFTATGGKRGQKKSNKTSNTWERKVNEVNGWITSKQKIVINSNLEQFKRRRAVINVFLGFFLKTMHKLKALLKKFLSCFVPHISVPSSDTIFTSKWRPWKSRKRGEEKLFHWTELNVQVPKTDINLDGSPWGYTDCLAHTHTQNLVIHTTRRSVAPSRITRSC